MRWIALVAAGCGHIGFDAHDAPEPEAAPDAAPPSCAGLAPTCGPGRSASCCDFVAIPGGTFLRSHDVAADNAFPDTSHPATVHDFHLDMYKVSVGRFRAFVATGGGTQAQPPASGAGANPYIAGSGWDASWNTQLAATSNALMTDLTCGGAFQTWTGDEALPILCVTWYEAAAFCAWDGGFLPSEAEWNYAAAGGDEQRAYPWSAPPGAVAIDCSYANYDPGTPCVSPPGGGPARLGAEPNGTSKWGNIELAGNAWDWVVDVNGVYPDPCDDCAALSSTGNRVIRGGDYHDVAMSLRAAFRSSEPPQFRGSVGVRCARP
jgi:formylglycine-generating enzyme required for sulfatase activity